MYTITSVANPRIKEILKLRESKHRRRTKSFLIDGGREIDRAVQSGIVVKEFYGLPGVLEKYRNLNVPLFSVSETVLRKIAFGDRDEGLVAVAEDAQQTLDSFEQRVGLKTIGVVEGIEKPGNLGAIFRSADGAGIAGIIIADPLVDLYHPNVVRASLGTVFRLPSVSLDSVSAIAWLRQRGYQSVLAKCDGAISYMDYVADKPTAIVLGSEATGLSAVWSGEATMAVSLPMRGIADSLNVSVAAAVLFYHYANRQ